MWIIELVKEFLEWVNRETTYSGCGKCKSMLKFIFFGCVSTVIFLYLTTVDYSSMKTPAYFIFITLKIYVMIDVALYLMRF